MIPKIIHFCWFGKKQKPDLILNCISSWRRNLPDYEFLEWNEFNTDLSEPFVRDAYKSKKWAFVSDYIRIKKLYNLGGIYLDTDMLILKNFDELLINECFLGAENLEFINAAIIGAQPRNSFLYEVLKFYENLSFNQSISLQAFTIPVILTKIFKEKFLFNGKFEKIITENSVRVYPSNYFYPVPFKKKNEVDNYNKFLDDNSYAVHFWQSSWIDKSEFEYFKNFNYLKGSQIVARKIFIEKKLEKRYIKKLLSSIYYSFTKCF